MLHACVQRFDVTGNLKKFCKILRTKHALDRHVGKGCWLLALRVSCLVVIITIFVVTNTFPK